MILHFRKKQLDDEMASIISSNTWKLVDLPLSSRPTGCNYIFKKKMKVDGTIGAQHKIIYKRLYLKRMH